MTFHNISLRISNSNSKYTLKIFSDRAAMTRVAMGAAVATEVDREVMGVVATKTSPPKLCTVQMLNIKYSPCVLSLLSNNFHI